MKDSYRRAIDLASSDIDLDSLVSARFPLSEATSAFAYAASRRGDKTVVFPRG